MNAGNKILDLIPAGRSAWSRGVKDYAADLLDSLRDDQPITKQNLLNGANDWSHWAYGGCGMIYDADIGGRLCSPAELKRKKGGYLAHNSRESWLDVEAGAASQACRAILRAVAKLEKGE